MPSRVKILTSDDGEKRHRPKWCYAYNCKTGLMALCTSEYYGYGESGCEFEEGFGKITCPDCLEVINHFKKLKL